jgi:hypothetical protein
MGPMGCPEMLEGNIHYSLCNIPEECSSFPICTKLADTKIPKVLDLPSYFIAE